jgi:hypothetical protein
MDYTGALDVVKNMAVPTKVGIIPNADHHIQMGISFQSFIQKRQSRSSCKNYIERNVQ